MLRQINRSLGNPWDFEIYGGNFCLYKWSLLVIEETSNRLSIFYYWLPLVNREDQVQAYIKSNFRTLLPTRVADMHLLQ